MQGVPFGAECVRPELKDLCLSLLITTPTDKMSSSTQNVEFNNINRQNGHQRAVVIAIKGVPRGLQGEPPPLGLQEAPLKLKGAPLEMKDVPLELQGIPIGDEVYAL